ncbi:hypothetical protein FBU59_001023 [Linderina macrospora]|uniref:Uncharacterized protein n=1 Tax=Linderina macrospora TaxID=4868 RepID=A0ACC1JFB0_9FUNG|nr:hypothetical protein FBU59_001023 [Linderina macrospora]
MHGIGNVAHFPILSGAKVVQLREFDAHACLKAIDKYRPSVLLATHELLLDIYEAATRTAMGSLKLLGSEGQGFSADSVQVIFLREFRAPNAFKQKLAALFQARLVELYGYTETGLVAGVIAECPALPDSVGLLCPNVTARIVLDGRDLEAGQCGEILVKTPRLMMGYLGQQGTNSLDDGFFRTGDFGTVTESGVVVVKARFQDVIRLESGYVTPGEIEEEVRSRLKVSDCSVIKVKRESGFDAPFVFVARDGADGLDTSVAELIASFENMYPGIRGRLVDAIPRTTTGEVARSELMSLL